MSCIVFDQRTADKLLAANFPTRSVLVEREIDPLSFALEREQAVLILPSQDSANANVLQMTRVPQPENTSSSQSPAAPQSEDSRTGLREPRGILGLDGDAVYLDEEPEPERSWWQKLFRN